MSDTTTQTQLDEKGIKDFTESSFCFEKKKQKTKATTK